MKLGSLFSFKLKRGLAGRRQSLEIVKKTFTKEDRVLWMHAASLGEYEQGLPVLMELKEKYPTHKVLVTFFSPSGYENVVKKKTIADAICYLPFDKKCYLEPFLNSFKTDIFFTVKYDFWYTLLSELKSRKVKTYVVSAFFYENQVFYKTYGSWFTQQLKRNINWFFHQTKQSSALAKEIGLLNSSTSGDTRFDRVRQNLERDNSVLKIEDFTEGKTTVVFGSSWEAEERIAEMLYKKHPEVKLIIAPHDLKRVDYLKELFPEALLYSDIENTNHFPEIRVLIVDCIGLLSKLYSYGNMAIVGGGFHSAGLHNILEAAVFGIPVFFGNQYKKNPEADQLILEKGGKSFEDEFYAIKYISEVLKSPEIMDSMGRNAQQFILSQPNATDAVVKKITADFN